MASAPAACQDRCSSGHRRWRTASAAPGRGRRRAASRASANTVPRPCRLPRGEESTPEQVHSGVAAAGLASASAARTEARRQRRLTGSGSSAVTRSGAGDSRALSAASRSCRSRRSAGRSRRLPRTRRRQRPHVPEVQQRQPEIPMQRRVSPPHASRLAAIPRSPRRPARRTGTALRAGLARPSSGLAAAPRAARRRSMRGSGTRRPSAGRDRPEVVVARASPSARGEPAIVREERIGRLARPRQARAAARRRADTRGRADRASAQVAERGILIEEIEDAVRNRPPGAPQTIVGLRAAESRTPRSAAGCSSDQRAPVRELRPGPDGCFVRETEARDQEPPASDASGSRLTSACGATGGGSEVTLARGQPRELQRAAACVSRKRCAASQCVRASRSRPAAPSSQAKVVARLRVGRVAPNRRPSTTSAATMLLWRPPPRRLRASAAPSPAVRPPCSARRCPGIGRAPPDRSRAPRAAVHRAPDRVPVDDIVGLPAIGLRVAIRGLRADPAPRPRGQRS